MIQVCAEDENRRSFTEKRKSFRHPNRRSRLWTTTGARPDLDEISVDPQYKPKFKISSFLPSHQVSCATATDSTGPPGAGLTSLLATY